MMKQLFQRLIIISLLFCFNLKSICQTPAQRQVARPKGTTSAPFGFYEYLPSDYASSPSKTFPLVIFLHGMGELGSGNSNDLKKLINSGGLPGVVNRGKDFPFILISPQTSIAFYSITPTLNQLLEYVKATYRVDVSRIYLTGLSMGGAGTWFFAQDYPDKFAAIVPICGGGQPSSACKIKGIPIWAFHNSGDPLVGVHHTNWMIDALRACGGNPSVTIYQSNAHDAWTATYSNQNMWNWLLSKRKGTPPPTPPANKIPVVNAGPDKITTLPYNALNLTAEASDPDGTIASYTWTKVSGPNATMGGINSKILNLSGLVAGTYIFRIAVKDNANTSAFDEMRLLVNPANNSAPTVTVGPDKITTLPYNALNLTAAASDPDGTISSYTWTKVSGPGAIMGGINSKILNLSGLVVGTYIFRVTVKDNASATASDEMRLAVNPASNSAPAVTAGPDKITTLPYNALNITAAASDPDGTISSYQWTKVSGPVANMGGINSKILSLTELATGTYTFRITVKDNANASAFDEIRLIVNPANNLPILNGSADKLIHLPSNSLSLAASASDTDGSIISYTWTKVSGPAATLNNINTSNLNVSGLISGTYIFRITVKDNRNASVSDDVKVIVNAPPVINLGNDKGTTLPYNALNITALPSDADGVITSYAWTKVSGPGATMSGMNSNILSLSALVAGNYIFRVTVKDNYNATASDDIRLIVHPQTSSSSTTSVNSENKRIASEPLENNISDSSVKLYPNPAGDNFELDFGKELKADAQIQISDISGENILLTKEIKAEGFNSKSNVEVSFIPRGIYLVKIKIGYQVKTLRLIKL